MNQQHLSKIYTTRKTILASGNKVRCPNKSVASADGSGLETKYPWISLQPKD
jgi:hypothetical protein